MGHARIPQRLDKVWVAKRVLEGKQPNGYIIKVIKEPGDEEPEEVIVKHYGNEKCPEEAVAYAWGELNFNYRNETFGWMLTDEV